MKKHLICMFALVVFVSTTSFTPKSSEVAKLSMGNHRWFNFNGGLLEIFDPSYYSLDADGFPDCPPALGIIYCTVLALPNAYDPEHPDLGTIMSSRMRSLL